MLLKYVYFLKIIVSLSIMIVVGNNLQDAILCKNFFKVSFIFFRKYIDDDVSDANHVS